MDCVGCFRHGSDLDGKGGQYRNGILIAYHYQDRATGVFNEGSLNELGMGIRPWCEVGYQIFDLPLI